MHSAFISRDLLGIFAKQLALVLLMKRDAVSLYQRDEVGRRIARERRAREPGVL
jgi:hypothetical protein